MRGHHFNYGNQQRHNNKFVWVLYFTGHSKNSVLQISSIGYLPQQMVLSNQNEIKVKLKAATTGLDEAVVIGL